MKISDLISDTRNANKGTQRGRQLVAQSLKDYGAGRSILIDRNGVIIAGNKTFESAKANGMDEILVIQSDGSQIVAVQRTDLDLMLDSKAKLLAIADNRSAELGLEWDTAILSEFPSEDLKPFWDDSELMELGVTEPDFEPATKDEQGELDSLKMTECPACGHKFRPA